MVTIVINSEFWERPDSRGSVGHPRKGWKEFSLVFPLVVFLYVNWNWINRLCNQWKKIETCMNKNMYFTQVNTKYHIMKQLHVTY